MKHLYLFLLILIAIGSTAAFYSHNHANLTFDDAEYVKFAVQQYYGQFKPLQNPYAFGFLLPLPIVLAYHIFGFTLFADSLPFMAMFVLLIVVIFLTCKKLVPEHIAFATALMCCFSGFIVAYSPRVLPDIPIGLLVALAMYCLLDDNRYAAISAGIFIGLIVYIKLGAALLIPIFLLCLLLVNGKKKILWLLLGILIMIALYLAFIGFNLSVISTYSQNQVSLTQATLTTNLYEMVYILPLGYNFYFSRAVTQVFPLGLLFLLGLVGGIYGWYKRNMKVVFAFLIFISTYLYLFIGSEGIHTYVSITVVSRYIIWIAAPMAICAAYLLNWLFNYVKKKYGLKYAVLALITTVTIVFVSNLPSLIQFAFHTYNFIGAPI